MKKIVKASLLLTAVASLGVMSVNAKTMTTEDLNNIATIKVGSQEMPENIFVFGNWVFVNGASSANIQDAMDDFLNEGEEYTEKYRSYFDDHKAALIYKDSSNNWSSAKETSKLTTKNLTIEMTHLVGDLKAEHLSGKDIYDDGEYVERQELLDGKIAEIFVNENAPLSIADIKTIQKAADLGGNTATDINAYNMEAVSVDYKSKTDGNKVTISINKPLMSYYSNLAITKGNGNWIGLLVKTNKPITKEDLSSGNVKITLGTETVTSKYLDSSVYGGASNEFIIWVNDTTHDSKTLKIEVKDEKPITVDMAFESDIKAVVREQKVVANEDGTVVFENVTDGVQTTYAKINGEYVAYLYTTDESIKTIDYTINGDKKQATKDGSWNPVDMLQLLSASVKEPSKISDEDTKWNHEAVTVEIIEHQKTDKEQYDYIVRLTTNKVLKSIEDNKIDVLLDLSVKDAGKITIDGDIDEITQVSASTTWSISLDSTDSKIATIKNGNITDLTKEDEFAIKFEFVDETPELDIEITPAEASDLFKDANGEQIKANAAYQANMGRVDFTVTPGEDLYTAAFQQTSKSSTLAKFDKEGKTEASGKTWLAVLVDLGIDPVKASNKLTVQKCSGVDEKGVCTTWAKAEEITKDSLTADSKIGATGTMFALWINAEDIASDAKNAYYKFTSLETNQSVIVKFEIKQIYAGKAIKDIGDSETNKVTSVVIDEKYANEVSYNSNTKEFTLNDDTKEFVARTTVETTVGSDKKTETHEYTYVVKSGSSVCGDGYRGTDKCVVKVQNMELDEKNYVIPNEETINQNKDKLSMDDDQLFNASAVENVSIKDNVINVVFNKDLADINYNPNGTHDSQTSSAKLYALVVDLGVKASEIETASGETYIINACDKTDGWAHAGLANANVEGAENLLVLWLDADDTDDEITEGKGKTINLVHKSGDNSSTEFSITIKSSYEIDEKNEFKLSNTKNMELDSAELADKYDELLANNEGIKTSIENGKIVITYDKPINKADTKSYGEIGIILDLGINPEFIDLKGAEGLAIANKARLITDKAEKAKYGATGETEFVLMLCATVAKSGNMYVFNDKTPIELEFVTATTAAANGDVNPYRKSLPVTIVTKSVIDEITVKANNVTERSESASVLAWKYDSKQYEINQNRLNYTYKVNEDEISGTITIDYADKENKNLATYDLKNQNLLKHWYAIEIDLGRKISKPTDNGNFQIEEIDFETGKFIVWVNTGSSNAKSTLTVTDDYNKSTFNVTIDISKLA